MIQLEHLHIEEFRGIRSIDIPLGSKTFVVHGPNGSGKSGVVDAIDFALTGSIRRLSGQGSGSVSVGQHAPHVLVRTTPAAASVSLTIRDVATGKSAVLKRAVGSANRFTLTPDDPEVKAALAQAQTHPELTLSRREIIQYVISQPTTRATQIQALLKLDKLGTFRTNLGGATRKAAAEVTGANTALSGAQSNFRTHLGTADIETSTVLEAVNERRRTLGAPDLTGLLLTTDFMVDITAESGTTTVNLAGAITETNVLIDSLRDLVSTDVHRTTLNAELAKAGDGSAVLLAIKRRGLLETGLAAVSDKACPLCGVEWQNTESLRDHIEQEIAQSEEARKFLAGLDTPRGIYATAVNSLRAAVLRVVPIAQTYGDRELPELLRSWAGDLATHGQDVSTNERALGAAEQLTVRQYDAPDGVSENLTALAATLAALPAQSATVDARTFLTIANERWTPIKLASEKVAQATATSELASEAYDAYCQVMDHSLDTLYRTVEQDFSRYYRKINSDDEGSFTARFTPSQGSLDFTVDFYGIDMFPPNAYHSEGHQDGMGVCLYLALMKQMLGSDFRLAVLDDVVMSVDVNHRRQFCELLKAEFPDVQFIITTHDEVWARQMQSAGLTTSKQQVRFYSWSVDDGPLDESGDIWAHIEEDLANGDVNGAAHKLRRRLEAAAADISEAIGGSVHYRGDASYDLSEFLDAAKGRYGELLKKAAKSANSWNSDTASAAVQAKKDARLAAVPEQESEAWAINALVHNNDWAQMSVADFRPVLDSAKAFLNLFLCDNVECGGWIHVEGRPPESLRCDCGQYFLNLKLKPAAS